MIRDKPTSARKIWKKHYYIWPVPTLHIFFQKNASYCISEGLNYQMEIFCQRKEELKSQNCCAVAKLFSYMFIKYFVYKRPGKTYALERLVKNPSISSYDKSALPPAWLKCAISPSFVKNCKVSLAPCSSRDLATGPLVSLYAWDLHTKKLWKYLILIYVGLGKPDKISVKTFLRTLCRASSTR